MPIAPYVTTLAAALAAALPAAAVAQTAERHTLRGEDIAVYNIVGRVRLVPVSGRDVVVDVTRRGRDAGQLKIEQGPVDGRQTLRVIYPDQDIAYAALGSGSRTSTRVRYDGTFGDTKTNGFFSSHEITIRGDGRGLDAAADLTVGVPQGQRVSLHLVAGEAHASNVDGDVRLDVHSAAVTVDRARGRLSVDAGAGSVQVDGAEGNVDLDTGAGAVRVSHVHGERLRVDAGAGRVTAADIDVDKLDIDLGSGGAQLTGVRTHEGKIDAGSGSVDVELLSDVDNLRVDTGSGGITLRVPANLGAALDVDTGSGGIDAQIPITVTHRERDHLRGTIGDGRGRIVIDAGSGTVRIVKS